MAQMRFVHDAHLGRVFLFLDTLANYKLLSMTVMVTPCLWYVVGIKLVMSYVKFLQAAESSPFKVEALVKRALHGVP